MDEDLPSGTGLGMSMNTTDEFCRTLGDIPTYGLSGNREDDDVVRIQMPAGAPGARDQEEAEGQAGAWEEVGIDDTRVEIGDVNTQPILEEEPDVSRGVANALKLAFKKGYFDKGEKATKGSGLKHLRAVNYSIEDK